MEKYLKKGQVWQAILEKFSFNSQPMKIQVGLHEKFLKGKGYAYQP